MEDLLENRYITCTGNKFYIGEVEYRYIGINMWYIVELASSEEGKIRLEKELQKLSDIGVKNIRFILGSEGSNPKNYIMQSIIQSEPGIFNEKTFEAVDYTLVVLKKYSMNAVVILTNFWMWSGGMAEYIFWVTKRKIPNPLHDGDWNSYQKYVTEFFSSNEALFLFERYIEKVLLRVNTITGERYFEDKTIMSWEIANEPRYGGSEKNIDWIKRISMYIKKLDRNHLVCIGDEGIYDEMKEHISASKLESIDYITIHLWAENWGWYNTSMDNEEYKMMLDKAKNYIMNHSLVSKTIQKPIVLEEFGFSRDGGKLDTRSKTERRDHFFKQIIDHSFFLGGQLVNGCNLWSWAGYGESEHINTIMKIIGDPPHEPQGWYSIYCSDTKTLDIIDKANKKITEELSLKDKLQG